MGMCGVEDVDIFTSMEGVVQSWCFDRDCQMGGRDCKGGRIHLVVLLLSQCLDPTLK